MSLNLIKSPLKIFSLFTSLCISTMCPLYGSMRGWLSYVCVCVIFVTSTAFSYTASSSIVLHWIVMNVKHGCLTHVSVVLVFSPEHSLALSGSLSIYYVSEKRKRQMNEWWMEWGEIISWSWRRSRWLGDNSTKWIVRWNCSLRNRSGDAGRETRKLTCWTSPSPSCFSSLLPVLFLDPSLMTSLLICHLHKTVISLWRKNSAFTLNAPSAPSRVLSVS